MNEAEAAYKTAVETLDAAQRTSSTTPKSDKAARGAAIAAVEAAHVRVREAKAAVVEIAKRRNFAGIGSPIHEAIVARLDPSTVAALEEDALARLSEREARSAERKAARAVAAPPLAPEPAAPPAAKEPERLERRKVPAPMPEVRHRRPQGGAA